LVCWLLTQLPATETEDKSLIEVVSVKFKNRGKSYYFSPNGLQIENGMTVIVETSKGLEIVDCCRGNHMVMDTAVVQPLRPVVRIATDDDLRVAELNKKREKEAFEICQQKIAEHGLDMHLVDVECNFEGNKTMFFFTADGRVDFRELVKDLAGIFRNRIELRQIGVRDEAKMIGGLGICGRPYCCNQFLDDFQPVSTKMAKVQSLSLNPAKISGSCGRLMCCLRYEQEAYEDLVKKVPRQGAFVETKDGYGTAVQVNLLRQTVKVKLDDDSDDSLRLYKSNELCAVPGGRPKDGEAPAHVLNYVPEPEEPVEVVDDWVIPDVEPTPAPAEPAAETAEPRENRNNRNRNNRRRNNQRKPRPQNSTQNAPEERQTATAQAPSVSKGTGKNNRNKRKTNAKVVKVEAKPVQSSDTAKASQPPREGAPRRNNYRRRYNNKPKTGGENKQS
jgi:cell fate regulator YaaT (PSP1 superfamily)